MTTRMTIEEWETTFEPNTNPFDPNASWDGIMFETYGKELEYVHGVDDHYVWTLMDSDTGVDLVPSYCFVNRIGYFVTKKPWTDPNIVITVINDMPEDWTTTDEGVIQHCDVNALWQDCPEGHDECYYVKCDKCDASLPTDCQED